MTDPVLNLLFRALMSMFPSLMSSFMNLFVRSSSISWHFSRSLKSGLSKNESLNSRAGNPIVLLTAAEKENATKPRNTLIRMGSVIPLFSSLVNSRFFFSLRLQLPFQLLELRIQKAYFRHVVSYSITRRRSFLSPTRIPINPAFSTLIGPKNSRSLLSIG